MCEIHCVFFHYLIFVKGILTKYFYKDITCEKYFVRNFRLELTAKENLLAKGDRVCLYVRNILLHAVRLHNI